jgi:hypothetical protein
MTIGDICEIKTNFLEADFWIQRRGDKSSVGKPLKEYYEENIGIRVKDEYRDKVDPTYLYYYFMFLHQKGVFGPISHGSLKLQNIRLSDIKSIPVNFGGDVISESIKASEAYNDMGSIQTIIDGKRDIGFIGFLRDSEKIKDIIRFAVNNGVKLIEVGNRVEGKAWVIYKNNKENAMKLVDFAESKNGYLRDETPEEARFVGELLGYSEESIQEYITNRYFK